MSNENQDQYGNEHGTIIDPNFYLISYAPVGAPGRNPGLREKKGKGGENPKDRLGHKKPDLSLLSPLAKLCWAMAATEGDIKYGPYNWRKSAVKLRVYVSAMQRHIDAFTSGEDYAPDTGVHHMGHVMACAAIIIDAMVMGTYEDDRPLGEGLDYRRQIDDAEQLLQKWNIDLEVASPEPESVSKPKRKTRRTK